jgi:hypothetical protein
MSAPTQQHSDDKMIEIEAEQLNIEKQTEVTALPTHLEVRNTSISK